MAQPRKRQDRSQDRSQSRSQGRRRGAERTGPPAWTTLAGVAIALGLAFWAALSLLTVSARHGDDAAVTAPPAHAEIDEASRRRLVEILREDGGEEGQEGETDEGHR